MHTCAVFLSEEFKAGKKYNEVITIM